MGKIIVGCHIGGMGAGGVKQVGIPGQRRRWAVIGGAAAASGGTRLVDPVQNFLLEVGQVAGLAGVECAACASRSRSCGRRRGGQVFASQQMRRQASASGGGGG